MASKPRGELLTVVADGIRVAIGRDDPATIGSALDTCSYYSAGDNDKLLY